MSGQLVLIWHYFLMSLALNRTLETETLPGDSSGLDQLAPESILSLLHDGQLAAAKSIRPGHQQIAPAAQKMAECVQLGGKLIYIGAGSSGLMAMADGLELQGTFGIANEQVRILFAGGAACLSDMKGGPEDDEGLARDDVARAAIKEGDCAILVTASGSTPYTLAAMREVQAAGGIAIGLANNSPSPLLENCDYPIHLPTPPEIIAGSTRMGAGTAQKIALNMLSTLMGIHLGHVHDGMMVNLNADNDKLRDRSQRIVMQITNCSPDNAALAIERAGGSVKTAVLLAAGADNLDQARLLLTENRGKLRAALSGLAVSISSV